jgi:sorbitol-6-phosphate 2-dehydrogenase
MDTNTIISIAAPTLRGLTFDGQKGAFVLFDGASPAPAGSPTLPAASLASLETLPDMIAGALQGFRDRTKTEPVAFSLEGVGTLWFGRDADEAMARRDGRKHTPMARGPGFLPHLENKVAVVTGAAQGFGEGIARELVKAGTLVYIADINLDGAKALCQSINSDAGRTATLPVRVDVTSEDSIREMVATVVATGGGIDLFVNNAGVLKAGSVKTMELKDFEFVTKVNYTGYFLCVKHVSAVMARMNRPGKQYFTDIIQINSKSGLQGSNRNGAYAGGKFGGIGLTQSFALELVEDNIKVNAICPGNYYEGPLWSDPERGLFVQYLRSNKVPGAKTIAEVKEFYTSKVPMRRGCSPEDVAKAISYAVDQKYETGQAIPITGGQVMR